MCPSNEKARQSERSISPDTPTADIPAAIPTSAITVDLTEDSATTTWNGASASCPTKEQAACNKTGPTIEGSRKSTSAG